MGAGHWVYSKPSTSRQGAPTMNSKGLMGHNYREIMGSEMKIHFK